MPYYTYAHGSDGQLYKIRHHSSTSSPPKPHRRVSPPPIPLSQTHAWAILEPVRKITNQGLDQQARVVKHEDSPGMYAQSDPEHGFYFPKPILKNASLRGGGVTKRDGHRRATAELHQTNSGQTVRIRTATPSNTRKAEQVPSRTRKPENVYTGDARIRTVVPSDVLPRAEKVGNARIVTVGPSVLCKVDSLPGRVRVQTVAPIETSARRVEKVVRWDETTIRSRRDG